MDSHLTLKQFAQRLPNGGRAEVHTLIAWALFDWFVIFAGWGLIIAGQFSLAKAAGVAIVASRLHALGAILHDACHSRGRSKTARWWVVEALAGWPIASTIEAMRYHHIRHHRDSGMRSDPYWSPLIARGPFMRALLTLRGALLPFWWTLRAFVAPVALVLPGMRNFYGRAFLQDRSGRDLRNHAEVILCARADLAQALAHCVGCAVIVWFKLPFVSCYLLPWMLGGMLNARRVIVEHSSAEIFDRLPATTFANTRTHDAGWLINAFQYPHHIGLHQAHHVMPAISFVHLPSAHAALFRDR
jgi:fatty acid desaturase